MRTLNRLFLTLGLCLALPAAAQPLGARLQDLIRQPRYEAAQWAIHVVSLDSGRIVYDHNGGRYALPASSAKLFPAALALCRLGPDHRIRTSVYAQQGPDGKGVVKGDLILYGRGDPLLMPRWRGHNLPADGLEDLAAQVAKAGVRVVQGDLVGDDSHFRTRPFGSGWEAGDRGFAFGADVSALTVHDNMVTLRVYPGAAGRPCFLAPMPGKGLLPLRNRTVTGPGPDPRAEWDDGELVVTGALAPGSTPAALAVPVREPARFAAELFRRALARHGVTVKGGVRAVHARDRVAPLATAGLAELARLQSQPLKVLLRETLGDSVNLYAQLLLLQMGGSEEEGLKALQQFLGEIGIRPGEVILEEGSGLSRKDLVKPRAVVALLRYLRSRPEYRAFEDALPLAGVEGTLQNRFLETPAFANLRAKTGTLRNTHALAGYLTTAAGEHLAFMIALNNYVPPADGPSGAESVDAVAVQLALEGR